jgi:hypothetical protein
MLFVLETLSVAKSLRKVTNAQRPDGLVLEGGIHGAFSPSRAAKIPAYSKGAPFYNVWVTNRRSSTANRGTAAEICEKQWPDHWSDRSRCIKCISARPKKAWLNRVKIAAHFKFKFLIDLYINNAIQKVNCDRCLCGFSDQSRRIAIKSSIRLLTECLGMRSLTVHWRATGSTRLWSATLP